MVLKRCSESGASVQSTPKTLFTCLYSIQIPKFKHVKGSKTGHCKLIELIQRREESLSFPLALNYTNGLQQLVDFGEEGLKDTNDSIVGSLWLVVAVEEKRVGACAP